MYMYPCAINIIQKYQSGRQKSLNQKTDKTVTIKKKRKTDIVGTTLKT